MSVLRRSTFGKLAQSDDGYHVSIYLPVERAGDQTQQNPIRFKNGLQAAETKLEELGQRRPEREATLEPAYQLLDDHDFWQAQDHGLAVLLHDGEIRTFRLPASVNSLTVVGNHFHLKPLIPFIDDGSEYVVLALERGGVQLYRGDHYRIEPLPLSGTPHSLDEFLQWDDPETQLQWHTASNTLRFQGGDGQSVFHGHGAGSEQEIETEQLLRFLRALDAAIDKMFAGDRAHPLVLIGDDDLMGHYRKVSNYPKLLEPAVHTVPHDVSPEEVHNKTWPLVEDMLNRPIEEARQSFLAAEPERQVSDLESVVKAAYDGQVAHLFVPRGQQRWGVYDSESRTLLTPTHEDNPSEDLYDRAAVATVLHGGSVQLVPADQLPGDGVVAAVLRYPIKA